MFERVLTCEHVAEIAGLVRAGAVVRLAGVWGSSAPMLAAAVGVRRDVPTLLVCPHPDAADAAADDIEVLTGLPVEIFPAWEMMLPGSGRGPDGAVISPDHLNDEITGERLRLCTRLAEYRREGAQPERSPDGRGRPVILVASVMALMQPVPRLDVLSAARFSLRTGHAIDPMTLTAWLVDAEFESVDAVDQQGEFARRGGIVDIFPPGGASPVRVEFFGDTIESIRTFDPDTQRSTARIDGYELAGISAGRETSPDRTTRLPAYLPDDAIVCLLEPEELRSTARTLYRRFSEGPGGQRLIGVHKPESIFETAERLARLEISAFDPPERRNRDDKTVSMGIGSLQRLEPAGGPRGAEGVFDCRRWDELEALTLANEVWVFCENQAERDRFIELLTPAHAQLAAALRTGIGHVSRGFHWPGRRLAIIGHHELMGRHVHHRKIRRIRTGRPIDSFADLCQGDYVVHVAHGIARFDGLRTLIRDGRKEEFLTLRFADRALLHVPVTEIQLVQKYVGAGRSRPSLSRIGGAAWSMRKERAERATHDLAAEMLRLHAIRASSPGTSYAGTSDWLGQFEREFVYAETEDQISAMRQIYSDMAEARPMDRLLCGDVGYGKTELAMRAAFRVVEAGKQVAVLVPTTVLAAQHYRTFTERFADYPFEIDVISRFRSRSDQAKIIARAADGKIDILLGTHRLLSGDVNFADLGLVIIDEEQRFGVGHKERLKRMRATVEILTMTATPIPRTMHMALLGLRDISNLATPPLDRRAIFTDLCRPSDERVRAAVLRELDRKGQVFFVHNRVFDIESVADHIRSIVPEARVEVAHGRMPERALEKTMLRFSAGDIDVLVCTTIIESGLDIPTANTMFIDDADRFGLSQLHQLRGRIGRYKHRAYCCLLLPRRRPVSRVAARRLKAVEEFSDLGAGFQIAMRDLEIRGAGNILGSEQSGHIAAVGYELYCRLLEQAVSRLRGEDVSPPPEVHVELSAEAYIPKSYITSPRRRMEAYRQLAICRAFDDLERLGLDLADAYGPLPDAVQSLLTIAEIKLLAGRAGIIRIVLMPPDVVFSVGAISPAKGPQGQGSCQRGLKETLTGLPGTVRLADPQTAHWRPPERYLEHPTLPAVLRKHLRRTAGTV